MFKQEKGVTLVALVITIIVLLILAGVSIAMLTGDNGLLTKSSQTTKDNAIAGAKDEISLEAQTALTTYLENKYTNPTANTAADAGAAVIAGIKTKTGDSTAHGCTISIGANKITITYEDRKVEGNVSTEGTLTWNPITNV